MLGLLMLAIAVSIDGLAAGMAFGMKKIVIPLSSILIVGISSGGVIAVSMPLGNVLQAVIPQHFSHWIGAVIFICIGLLSLFSQNPIQADRDHSGEISAREALTLGIALSVDSIGAGVSAALLGFTIWLTAVTIAVSCASFIWMGSYLGQHMSCFIRNRYLSYIPGLLLIVLGMIKLL
ncbi:MAG: manganese efflux pump MntP [Bacillota bacterium]|jgi:putative Mn2+ efflux pump MntP